MELIDRSTLGREILLKVCLPCPLGEDFECKDCPLDKAVAMVEAVPTIDAVPVVRCKDCKHTDDDGCGAIYCKKWDRWEMPEDAYCYLGARMDGERREG